MAIVSSLWLRGSRKRLAGTVIYQAMGQTRQRELAATVSNPRTQSQQTQRVKWSNLVNLYRANASWMKYAFETKKVSQSEYNKFMSLNVSGSNIYLPKHVANAGGCVVTPYIVTQGSLPSIEWVQEQAERFVSNIVLSDGYQFANPTIAAFSQMLISLNPAIRQGDQLSFIRETQMTNGDTGIPYVIVRKYEFIVDTTDNRLLSAFWPLDIIDSTEATTDCRLMVAGTGGSGAFAMVLSRTTGGKTYVSSQRLMVVNNATMINAYSSAAALQAAIDSYGVSDDAFLSTITAEENSQAPTLLSPLSANFNNLGDVVAGSRFTIDNWASGDTMSISFNGDVPSIPETIIIYSNKGSLTLTSLARSGAQVDGDLPESTVESSSIVVYYIIIVIGGITYRIDFLTTNDDTIHGLE